MALKKCKECGNEVSSKAKECPSCGHPVAPEKTGCATYIVVAIFIFIGITVFTGGSDTVTGGSVATVKTPAEPPKWQRTRTSVNEMTGVKIDGAHSPEVSPNRRMSFPYADVTSEMYFGCKSASRSDDWVYLNFSKEPNLASATTKTRDGYSDVYATIRFDDDEARRVMLTQSWGAKLIGFNNNDFKPSELRSHSRIKVQLQWHGEQPVIFDYSLLGSAAAIDAAIAACAE